MTSERAPIAERVKSKLLAELPAEEVVVVDESHMHRGHAGAKGGGAHLRVKVVASIFMGKGLLARHRMVNAILAEELKEEIHALAIDAHHA